MGLDNGAICHARFPKAGLGNKLFIWARAWIFAKKNNIPLVVSGWNHFHRSPILAGGDFRLYWHYFKNVRQLSWLKWQFSKFNFREIVEPDINSSVDKKVIYIFNSVPPWNDYFRDIKPYRDEIKEALFSMLTNSIQKEYNNSPCPKFCVNVRLGDFKKLPEGVNFAHVGLYRTPMEYFQQCIHNVRQIHGSNLPVTLVSDGSPGELQLLLKIPNVKMGPKNSKIVDILMMSKSKILITSAGSTFAYWSGFLGDNALVIHRDHVHMPMRPEWVNSKFYEGPVDEQIQNWNSLLVQNIQSV